MTGHFYLSTSCHHGEHDYCKSDTVEELIPHWADGGAETFTRDKKPGECKFCFAPCICPCHREATDVAT